MPVVLRPNNPPAFSASCVRGPRRRERSPSAETASPRVASEFIPAAICGISLRRGSSTSSRRELMRVVVRFRLSIVDATFSAVAIRPSSASWYLSTMRQKKQNRQTTADLRPLRMLPMGCTAGTQHRPWCQMSNLRWSRRCRSCRHGSADKDFPVRLNGITCAHEVAVALCSVNA